MVRRVNLSAPPRPVPAPALVDAPARTDRRGPTGDARWVWGSLALVAVAAIVGPLLEHGGSQLFVNAAPLLGDRKPHLGIGTPFAIAFAVAAVGYFPWLVRRLRWRQLLVISWLAAVGWTVSLALIDGWQRGGRLRVRQLGRWWSDRAETLVPARSVWPPCLRC